MRIDMLIHTRYVPLQQFIGFHRRTFLFLLLGGTVTVLPSNTSAFSFGMDYTAEWQADFKGNYDWLTLLQVSTEIPFNKSIAIEAATISAVHTSDEAIVEDLLTYSNIFADNIPLTFSRLGFSFQWRMAEFFVGVNNVNENYFTSELTSFFTGSSCGISPTISCNYDIANYPVAALCLHYRQGLGAFSLQSSIYPGKGYYRIFGHDNLFNVNFKRDGIFSITSIDYSKNDIYCTLGVALHYGHSMADEMGEQAKAQPSSAKKTCAFSPWVLSEINLPHDLGLLVHGSMSTVREGCKWYGGLGLLYSGKRIEPGIVFNYAAFTSEKELSLELTARMPFLHGKCYLQPALHIIGRGNRTPDFVGALRINWSI